MTRIKRFRFRRLAVVLATLGLGLGLAAGTAAASTTGNPSPGPVSYGNHHHKPPAVRHCEFVELTGYAVDHDGQGQDVGYGSPRTAAPDQQGKSDENKSERVEVFQLAKVCETGEHLTVTDVTDPFAEESEGNVDHHDAYPTPDATAPSSYVG
jgi:hypothetical protein